MSIGSVAQGRESQEQEGGRQEGPRCLPGMLPLLQQKPEQQKPPQEKVGAAKQQRGHQQGGQLWVALCALRTCL
jgi:hypothetical protein